jgi:UDP-N-acetylglucosamine 1-carboxyvinyltransferase
MTLTVVPTPISIVAPQLEITGGRRLSGEVRVSGAKNSALVLMAACLLSRDTLRLTNVPPLTDIAGMGEILTALGVRVRRGPDWVELDASHLSQSTPPYELVNSLRASFFCIGPLWPGWAWPRCPFQAAARSAPGR